MNIKLSKNGIEELSYMIKNNKRSFPTYECPYEKNNCYLYVDINLKNRYPSSEDEYKYENRFICLKCKQMLLREFKRLNSKN